MFSSKNTLNITPIMFTILLFVVVVLPIYLGVAEAYAKVNSSCPKLKPLEEQIASVWMFYEGKDRFVEVDFTNEGFEMLFAGLICNSTEMQCRFTPPFFQNTGCYCCYDRGWYKLFVLEEDIDLFQKAWEPIVTLRRWKYQYVLPLAERLGLQKLFRENNTYEIPRRCSGEKGIPPPPPRPPTNTSRDT